MLSRLCSVRVWSSCQMAAAKEWYWKFDSAPESAILFCSTHLSRTPIFPIYGSWAATLCDTSPGTRFLPITANLSNPGSSTACVFTVSPQEFSLHCTSTGITGNLFYADFLPSPTHGAALLFDPSPWAACLPSATSHSVTYSRPAISCDPSSLSRGIHGIACLTRHYLLSMPLIQANCLYHPDNWICNLHNPASIHSKPS